MVEFQLNSISMELYDKVAAVFAEVLNIDVKSVAPELSVGDIPQWDSMGNLAVIAKLEEVFEIDFPVEELFDLTSVQSIVDKVSELTK